MMLDMLVRCGAKDKTDFVFSILVWSIKQHWNTLIISKINMVSES